MRYLSEFRELKTVEVCVLILNFGLQQQSE